jgi:ribosome-associated protein
MVQQLVINSLALADLVVDSLRDLKGKNIVKMNLTHISGAISDYYIICTGTSDTHVQALAESVARKLGEEDEKPISREGERQGEWILLDYVNVVVHIFQQKTRDFYRIESLWGDADIQEYTD